MRAHVARRSVCFVLLAATLAASGCRGRSWGPGLRLAAARRLSDWLSRSGVIPHGVLIDVGQLLLALFALTGTALAAVCCYLEARAAPMWPALPREHAAHLRRCLASLAVLTAGGLGCAGLTLGGLAPERLHCYNAGLLGFLSVWVAAAAVARERWRSAALLGLLASAALVGAGWRLSEPPTDERVSVDRLSRRGVAAVWERIDGERHVVSARIEDGHDEELKRGEVDSLLADLCRLPHLKEVRGVAPTTDLPRGVFEKLRLGLPGVVVLEPFRPGEYER